MSSFCDNKAQYSAFFGPKLPSSLNRETFKHVDWPALPGDSTYQINTLDDLIDNPEPELRVIFAPLDLAGNLSLKALFQHYSIPADFLTERICSVPQASGTRTLADRSQGSWFHYLCKNIDVRTLQPEQDSENIASPAVAEIVELHQGNPVPLSQDNWTWLRSAFFLKCGPDPREASVVGEDRSSDEGCSPCVTLICFGASSALQARFEKLASRTDWKECLGAPYALFVVVLDEIFLEMDEQAWRLAGVFRGIEHTALTDVAKTSEVWITSSRQDVVGLHNVAKHCVYLKEAFEAIVLTVEALINQNQENFPETRDVREITSLLRYKMGLFRGVNLRLASLEKRVGNIISLSFNLITAQDSRVIRKDSHTMKSIAMLALVFLPSSTIAAIFSSPFFSVDDAISPPRFRVSEKFWIFWCVASPVTVLVIILWMIYNRVTIRRWEKDLRSQ